MTDINTSNTANTTNKSKKEIKQEKKDKKFALKLEAKRVKKVAKLEKKKAKLTRKLNATANPSKKSSIQDKLDKVEIKINNLKNPTTTDRPFKVVIKTWGKGLKKEAGRIAWHDKANLGKDFLTILLVCAFLAIIFFAIDMIIISLH
ncbi:MAG: preprotein translocase subunit SecE [Mycoplasmoidaceae bacterium]